MVEQRAMNVSLIPRDLSHTIISQAWRGLTQAERHVAHTVLRQAQGRHVGLTAELAAQLAPCLLRKGQPEGIAPGWRAVLDRLSAELRGAGSRTGRTDRGYHAGLLLNARPTYTVLRLVLPLLAEANRRLGRCLLYSDDPSAGTVDLPTYRAYATAMERTLIALSSADEAVLSLFWRERALTLAHVSRPWPRDRAEAAVLPQPATADLAFFLRLRPRIQTSPRARRLNRPLLYREEHHRGQHQKEGGIDGIQRTTRLEDMDHILHSEFLTHAVTPIFADRLINSGYLAFRRQPKRESPRDVLVAAILPWATAALPSAPLLRACWFEYALHLGYLMCRTRLRGSVFQWIEGDRLGKVHTHAFRLADLPSAETGNGTGPGEGFRRAFLTALGWMPGLLDKRAPSRPDRATPPHVQPAAVIDGNEAGDPVAGWIRRAWTTARGDLTSSGNARDDRGWHAASGASPAYASIHLMACFPSPSAVNGSGAVYPDLGALRHQLHEGAMAPTFLGVTRVPAWPEPSPEWIVEREGGAPEPLFGASRSNTTIGQTADRLASAWYRQTVREIWRD